MPTIRVKINYDQPYDPMWLSPDNVARALGIACSNTHFTVQWADDKAERDYLWSCAHEASQRLPNEIKEKLDAA
jgi:hypothetical protein